MITPLALSDLPDRFEGLHGIDYVAILLYLAAVVLLGYYFSRRQSDTEEYFLAGRNMPWFAVGTEPTGFDHLHHHLSLPPR